MLEVYLPSTNYYAKMTPTYDKIHNRFKLNRVHYSKEELMEVAYSFVKEGLDYERSIGDFLIDWLNPLDHVFVKTSGSTGEPKTIRLEKQKMVNSAIATGDHFDVTVGDTALHCLPADFIAGKMMLVRAMILGLEIDLIEPTSDPQYDREYSYHFAAMIPLQVANCFDHLGNIDVLIVGGAPIPYKLLRRIQEPRTRIYETYGMTETITHIAARKLNHFRMDVDYDERFFRTLPDVSISTDARGCLVIDAPNVSDETIVTNDLVRITRPNEFEWLGRIDNVINSGGVKLIPEEIEPKLSPAIPQRFILVGMPDERLGEQMVLIVEGEASSTDALLDKLRTLDDVGRYEIPRQVFFIEHFPETENGKIKRKEASLTFPNSVP